MDSWPAGTLTFLFTDIEGSTRLWEQHPAAMRLALPRQETLVRAGVEAQGGRVFKMVGDSVYTAFPTAAAALRAAVAIQQALVAEDWAVWGPGGFPGLRVRLALHAGAAEARGGDYFGPPLNRVARLLVAGHGGQILLSGVVQELVVDQLPNDVQLRDLGVQALKDLARPEHIYQVVAPGLPGEFPPLVTLASRPNNLPIQPTALVGREREVAAAVALLRGPEVRLLTLTGPGGTGKTRLGLQVAADLLGEFADGVFFVPLAPIRDPALVGPTIAAILGVREAAGRPPAAALQEYLRDRQLLLLLDNFEQVPAAAALVADLLAAAPRGKVLVTSRALLHLYGEQEYAVPPLALPAAGATPAVDALAQYEAVALFIQRARAVKLDFRVTNENAPAVAEICVRLDGLPLAIELAAARSKLYPPPALLSRLSSRLGLLTGGPRDLPARQQTLRGAIDWSYDLLAPAAQQLFARLAVFVGGCTVAAAAAVGRDEGSGVRGQGSENDPENDPRITDPAVPNPKSKIQNPKSDAILDGLVELADQSLLRQVAGADGEPRFIMLETVREYAWERLEAQGEAAALQCRHAEFFVAWAQPPPPGAPAPPLGVIIARREEEHDNLRAVLQWTLDHGEAEMALRLAGALWGFWDRQGYLSEGRRWLDAALAQRAQAPVRARLAALYGAGILACSQGEPAAGEVWLAERLALGRELHDPPVMAWSLYGIAWAATGQGDFARVVRLGTECLALFREQANKEGVSLTLRRLATAAQVQGDLAQARAYTEESLARDRERDDAVGVAANLSALGELARLHGDYTHAAAYYEESLALNRVGGVKTRLIPVLHNLGHVALHEQNTARAAILFAEGLGLSRELGHKPLIAACLAGLAGVAAGDHQPERAARLFGAVDHLHQQIGGRLESIDQAEYDRNLATARAGLDAAAWDQAWRAGALLTLEQAIAYAVPVES